MTEEHAAPGRRIRSRGTIVAGTVVVVVVLAGGAAGLGLALTDAGASTPVPSSAGCGGGSPMLTVQGTGQASGTPDVLDAVFSFSTSAGSSAAALSQNNGEVGQAITALTGAGVAKRDLQTTALNLSPQYVFPHGVPKLTGYQASETLSATLRETATAGTALDAVVNATGNAAQIQSLTFSFGDPTKVQDAARTDAVAQAKSHAEAMAASADRRLGTLCSLTDNTQPPTLLQGQGFDAAGTNAAAAIPLEPGTQMQSDQVTMVYALRQR
jgi:uncharacterized protein